MAKATAASAATTAASSLSPPGPISIDTQHEDLVHDAQMDYYGAKLATCSSGEFLYSLDFCCVGRHVAGSSNNNGGNAAARKNVRFGCDP